MSRWDAERGRVSWYSLALSALVLGGSTVAVALETDSQVLSGNSHVLEGLVPTTRLGILLRNVSVAVLLFSGVVSGGLFTLVAGFSVAVFLGMALGMSAHAVGWLGVVGATWNYSVFEFSGFVLAAAGGLYPLVRCVVEYRKSNDSSPFVAYYRAIGEAVPFMAVAIVCLAVGAFVEGYSI